MSQRSAAGVGPVVLQVADLGRSLAFYRDLVGLRALEVADGRVRLGADGDTRVLLELREKRGIRPVPRGGLLGLYHFALLLPDRPSLGRFLRHVRDTRTPAGAADHVFSEALYLTDPDGLQMEVYRDLPRDTWRTQDGELVSGSDPLDAAGLLEAADDARWTGVPSGSVIGHVHFFVGDLGPAEVFYHRGLGLERRIWSWPGALFMAAGGYHHHVGVNTWAAGAPVATDDDARLIEWTLEVPTDEDVEAVSRRLAGFGQRLEPAGDGAFVARDAWGIACRVTRA